VSDDLEERVARAIWAYDMSRRKPYGLVCCTWEQAGKSIAADETRERARAAIEACGVEGLRTEVARLKEHIENAQEFRKAVELACDERLQQYKHEVRNARRWQPIEGAPEDTAVLVYNIFGYKVAHFNTALKQWVECRDNRPLRLAPTHWVALPAKPGDSE
jgi:hypothetical protein